MLRDKIETIVVSNSITNMPTKPGARKELIRTPPLYICIYSGGVAKLKQFFFVQSVNVSFILLLVSAIVFIIVIKVMSIVSFEGTFANYETALNKIN